MKLLELNKKHYNPYFQTYINTLNKELSLLELLKKQVNNFPEFMAAIPAKKLHYAYADGKWTLAEALQHIIDTERVFQYRALRFARKDRTPLSSFDENLFASEVNMENSSIETIINEYKSVRTSTISLFTSFNQEALNELGTVGNSSLSVAAAGFIICAHQKHHRNIIRKRYL